MQERFKKYFWEGDTGWSDSFKLRRIIEVASFPDLINYPFEGVKKHLPGIDLDKLWTGPKRKEFMKRVAVHVPNSNSWEEAIDKTVQPFFENQHVFIDE